MKTQSQVDEHIAQAERRALADILQQLCAERMAHTDDDSADTVIVHTPPVMGWIVEELIANGYLVW